MASDMQEKEVGDGTNFVIIFGGQLLQNAGDLLQMVFTSWSTQCLFFQMVVLTTTFIAFKGLSPIEKTAKEVAKEINSELQQSELNLYYWKENQLIQNKTKN